MAVLGSKIPEFSCKKDEKRPDLFENEFCFGDGLEGGMGVCPKKPMSTYIKMTVCLEW